jgi:hypothetical protein
MAKLVIKGNMAIFEYPKNDNPFFEIDKEGNLFIHGYEMEMMGKIVKVAKRYELNLKGYTPITTYPDALNCVEGDIESVIDESNIDRSCALVLLKGADNEW